MQINEAVYDLLERVRQVSDDADITESLAKQWLSAAASSMLPVYFRQTGNRPGAIYKEFTCQLLTQEVDDCVGCTKRYMDLPITPLSLTGEMGVFVYYPGGNELTRLGSAANANRRSRMKFFTGGWYVIGNRVHLKGNFPDGIKFDLLIIPGNYNELSDSDQLPVPSAVQDDVIKKAFDIAVNKLSIPQDEHNDGTDEDSLRRRIQ